MTTLNGFLKTLVTAPCPGEMRAFSHLTLASGDLERAKGYAARDINPITDKDWCKAIKSAKQHGLEVS